MISLSLHWPAITEKFGEKYQYCRTAANSTLSLNLQYCDGMAVDRNGSWCDLLLWDTLLFLSRHEHLADYYHHGAHPNANLLLRDIVLEVCADALVSYRFLYTYSLDALHADAVGDASAIDEERFSTPARALTYLQDPQHPT
jgi:hypothetical protein